MKVVHVITNLAAGGAELMLRRLIAESAKAGEFDHEVISLMEVSTVGEQLKADGVPVIALGARSLLDLPRVARRLTRELRYRAPEVVHCWLYLADLVGGLCAKAAGVRSVVWNVRTSDIDGQPGIRRSTRWVRSVCSRLSARVPDAIVYVAEAARAAHERFGYAASKSIVIPNGYEPRVPGDPAALKRELGLGESALIVATVGRFSPYKDPRAFVLAAAQAAQHVPDARFVMIGRGYSDENAELAGWIFATGCGERFHLLGERRDVQRLLPGVDVFCLHSTLEGFPNVVAEAMLAGVPCVVTDVGDARAIVDGTGLVVPPQEPRLLANAIVELASYPPSKRADLGRQARARIESRYSLQAVSARYGELYRGLSRQSPVYTAPARQE